MTETATVVCSTAVDDIWFGSSGCLLPGIEARLITPDGKDITEYDTPGELLVRSPSVVLGYLNNEKATKESFIDGWLRTGDEAMIRLSPNKTEHVWIVDRIKELIKVKVRYLYPTYIFSRSSQLTHFYLRVCKLPPLNLKHICLITRSWRTARSSQSQTKPPAKFPRRSW